VLSIHPKCFVQSARSLDLVVTVLLHPVRRFDPESFLSPSPSATIGFHHLRVGDFSENLRAFPSWHLRVVSSLFSYMLHDTFFF
jgi:hypothetical protein